MLIKREVDALDTYSGNRSWDMGSIESVGTARPWKRSVACRLTFGATLAVVAFSCACAHGAPVPKGSRVLGIQVNEAEDRDYPKAFATAKSLGAEAVSLSMNWDDIEVSPGMFAPTPNYLAMANAFYPAAKMKLDLFIRPLDTNGLHLPRDLRGKPIDDPLVIDRFMKCLNWVLSQVPDIELSYLGIGNEIDVGMGKDWAGYRRYAWFLEAIKTRLNAKRPKLNVGASATLDGLVGLAREELREINRHTDLVIVTYYPLEPGVGVKDPSTVHDDFRKLADSYAGKPIVFSEAGYPSSGDLKSSQRRQAEFVRELFKAWDAHAAQVRQVTFYQLTDTGPDAVAYFTRYYGLSGGPFKAFLGSLGLRTFAGSGRDKEAFGALREEAKARGW